MAIEDWPQEFRSACSRRGWAKELLQQNLDVAHSRTVRIGSPTMCSKNRTQMVEHTILVGSHDPPKKTDSAGFARLETAIEYCCCAGGTALRGPVRNGNSSTSSPCLF